MPVSEGGTGDSTLTQYGVLVGNGSSAISVTAAGTTGQVLTATTGGNPTFQAPAAASITLNGDSGSITGSNLTIKSGVSTQNSGSSVSISGSGTTLTLNVTDANLNTIIGNIAGNATLTSIRCTGVGYENLHNLTSGTNNTSLGYASLYNVTSGTGNTGIGSLTHNLLTTGNYNTALGDSAGSSYTGAESSNICIGSFVSGTVGESNTLRIGAGSGSGLISTAYIFGIYGAAPATTANLVGATSGSQLATSPTGFVSSASIQIPAGTAASPSLNFTGSTTTGLSAATANTLVMSTSGTQRLNIDSTGSVLSQLNYKVFAYSSVNQVVVNTSANIVFGTTVIDTNGNFTNASGTYTVPVTGTYFISYTITRQTANQPRSATVNVLVNGVARTGYSSTQLSSVNNSNGSVNFSGIISLTAAQTVNLQYVTTGIDTIQSGGLTSICIYYLSY